MPPVTVLEAGCSGAPRMLKPVVTCVAVRCGAAGTEQRGSSGAARMLYRVAMCATVYCDAAGDCAAAECSGAPGMLKPVVTCVAVRREAVGGCACGGVFWCILDAESSGHVHGGLLRYG